MTRWIDPQPVRIPDALKDLFGADETPYGLLLAELLARRGITQTQDARAFLDPALYVPTPPDELPDLALTVQRLQIALREGQKIAIWGDFDVDGQTATALYVQALRALGADLVYHIPSRRESHGVHPVGVQRLIDDGVRIIVTADTGVDAHKAIELAVAHGLEVIVTDHHDLPATPPDALALVNPKRLPIDHPLYELPGVGVAYQVISALYAHAGRPTEHLLDLVALGIVADVATLTPQVRYLLQCGLDVLRRAERLGLKAMMALANINPALINEEDIGFTLAPRLNALSRVGEDLDATTGVELLITGDLTRARTLATALEALNAQRKFLVQETTEAALALLERDRSLLDGPALVVAGTNWEAGIVGIVAGRLAERFNRPAIVFSAPEGEIARGSARSIEGVDIHAALAANKEMLYRCGGHPMAAGVSLPGERIPEFRRALWRTLDQAGIRAAEKQIRIDACLNLEQVSLDMIRAINRLAPFGPGNERPIFALPNLELAGASTIGRTEEHRRLRVRDQAGREEQVFWWQSAGLPLPEGRFDLALNLGINTFRGQDSVQLTWVDARLVAPPTAPAHPAPGIEIADHRLHANPIAVLQAWIDAGKPLQTWIEGTSPADLPPGANGRSRVELEACPTLVVWTAPPSPDVFHQAFKAVSPTRLVLLCIDPGMDTPQAFLARLAGLVKHSLQARSGQTSLALLAALTAQTEQAVRLGLSWMGGKGQAHIAHQSGDEITLARGPGSAAPPSEAVQAQLYAHLQETAAYRRQLAQTTQLDKIICR